MLVEHPQTKLGVVAGNWSVSGADVSYEFVLRNTARWSDGSLVSMPDFLNGARRMLDPEIGSDRDRNFLYPICIRYVSDKKCRKGSLGKHF